MVAVLVGGAGAGVVAAWVRDLWIVPCGRV